MTAPIKPARTLVLGGGGFIGLRVSAELLAQGHAVLSIGHGDQVLRESSDRYRTVRSDITTQALCEALRDNEPEVIFHCAGSGSVGASYSAPKEDFERTVSTVAVALEAARTLQTSPRVVIASSAAVYGDQGDIDLFETAVKSPVSPYGFHKEMAEALCTSYSRFFGVKVSIVRFFSVYGEGLRKQLLWDAMKKFDAGCFEFLGTGNELRDWIHVDDAARLMISAGFRSTGSLDVFNGGHTQATTRDVLCKLSAFAGTKAPISFSGKTHTGNPRRLTSDSRHAQLQLNWLPTISLDEGLQRYAAWHRSLADT